MAKEETKSEGTDIVRAIDSKVVALKMDLEKAQMMSQALAESLGTVSRAWDFESIDMPAGDAIVWKVPTIEGPKPAEKFHAVIVAAQDVRQYYDVPFGEGDKGPPVCASPDARTGFGVPGGICDECELAKFGTKNAGKGRAPACQLRRHVLLLTEFSGMPYFLNVSPTSRSNGDPEPDLRRFMMQVAGIPAFYWHVVVEIGLRTKTNPDSINYGVATWKHVGVIPEGSEQRQIVDLFHNELSGVLTKHVVQEVRTAKTDGAKE